MCKWGRAGPALPAHHYAHTAFNDACLLHVEKKPSWVGEVVFVLSHLQVPVVVNPAHLAEPDSISDLIAKVKVSCACALQRDINESEKEETHLYFWSPQVL